MIVKIKSTNPHLATILQKNPNGPNDGFIFEPLKNGTLVGKFYDNEYHIVFLDTKYSYNPDMSNQIDFQSFASPNIWLDIVKTLFPNFFNKWSVFSNKVLPWENNKPMSEFDKSDYEHGITIENIYIDSTWARDGKFLLSRYFPEIQLVSKNSYLYTLNIKTSNTLFYALNLLTLTCLFLTLTNSFNFKVNVEMAQKYINVLKNIDNIPYFIVYLFKNRMFTSIEQFNSVKTELESVLPTLKLTYGNTHEQRISFIKQYFKNNENDILDVGCGELLYLKAIGPKLDSNRTYYAVDIDEGFERVANKLRERDNINCNVRFTSKLADLYDVQTPVDVLLTEVIEHMELDAAKNLIVEICENFNVNRFLITTPNRSFNQFYNMDSVMRHDDHKFELTFDEFKEFISETLKKHFFTVEYLNIGDEYQKITPTIGCILNFNK